MRKKIALALIGVAVFLTACGGEAGVLRDIRDYDRVLHDGTSVTCVQVATGNGVALSCDWDRRGTR